MQVCPKCMQKRRMLQDVVTYSAVHERQKAAQKSLDMFKMGILNDGRCDRCTYDESKEADDAGVAT